MDKLGATFSPEVRASSLKVAEQQQVDIARAIAHDSRILIMDEPTAALSEREIERLFSLIATLKAQGMAIVYISHRLSEVGVIADRVSVLRDGRYVGTVSGAEIDNRRIVSMMVGRPLDDFYGHETAGRKEKDYLVVREISDGKRVKGVSFAVDAGEITAIAGLVGSGRTELARLIFGADRRESGEVLINGEVVTPKSPQEAIARGIGYVPEERKSEGLFLGMSALENIRHERDAAARSLWRA